MFEFKLRTGIETGGGDAGVDWCSGSSPRIVSRTASNSAIAETCDAEPRA